MYVKNAVYDEWDHNTDIGGMIEITSWEIAENLIKSLDGSKYTQVILSNELDDSFICIGGGNNGFYQHDQLL
jgi:signal peptidase I